MTTRLIVTIEVELEVTDNDALAAAALSKERSRHAIGRTEESFAQLEKELHALPGLGEGFLREDPMLLFANVPGVIVTGSRSGGRFLAEGERLFPGRQHGDAGRARPRSVKCRWGALECACDCPERTYREAVGFIARLRGRLNGVRREVFGWRIPGATPPTVPFPKRPTLDSEEDKLT